jgi:hypothetical protein
MGATIPPRGICSLEIVTKYRSKECSIDHILERLWHPVIQLYQTTCGAKKFSTFSIGDNVI